MRSSYVAAAIAALSVGLTAAAALHRRSATRLPVTPATTTTTTSAATTSATTPPVVALPEHDGVVLPFVRPVATAPAPAQPSAPARCGDNGGITKAGAPCAARATAGGRCHHHRVAA
jgi:hypothetical protein